MDVISRNHRLQTSVIELAHTPLHEHSVHVVAIGPVAGIQVFVDADQRSGRHTITILRSGHQSNSSASGTTVSGFPVRNSVTSCMPSAVQRHAFRSEGSMIHT